jgi:NADH-quinone oxidoreductase subunit N
MLSAVVAAYLYLRIVVAMYFSGDVEGVAAKEKVRVPVGAGLALGVCLLVTIGFGIFPDLPTDWAAEGVPTLVQFTTEAAPTTGLPLGP